MLGWNVAIIDGDGQPIVIDGVTKPYFKPIEIGNHVWLCAESHVLKGAKLGDNCVLAYRSLLIKEIDGDNLLVGGSPAKIIDSNINWKEK